jgi:uncharacterized cupin superfamily protein
MVAHIDDVETTDREFGHIRARRQYLGMAAGSRDVGCSRWRVAPGDVPAPQHVHADEDEIFYVLSGDGLVLNGRAAFAIGAGDAIVFPANHAPHTVVGGDGGLEVLAFSSGSQTGLTWLPRANMMWAGPRWLPLGGAHPFQAEQSIGPLELPEVTDERPPWLVTLAEAGRAGTDANGLALMVIPAGERGHPPHCHSAEEELFYVLDGTGELRLGDETFALRPGHVVARPPGTGIAHAFHAATDGPLTLLAYGQRDARDTVFYPESSSVRLQGLGRLRFLVEPIED